MDLSCWNFVYASALIDTHIHMFSLPSFLCFFCFVLVVEPFSALRGGVHFLSAVCWDPEQLCKELTCCFVGEEAADRLRVWSLLISDCRIACSQRRDWTSSPPCIMVSWFKKSLLFLLALVQLSPSITVAFSAHFETISCTVFCESRELSLAQEDIYTGEGLFYITCSYCLLFCQLPTMSRKSCFLHTCKCWLHLWIAECKLVLSRSPWRPSGQVRHYMPAGWDRETD